MKIGEKLVLVGIVLAVVSCSFLLGRSLWIQREEQSTFEVLRMEIEKSRLENQNEKPENKKETKEIEKMAEDEENENQRANDILPEYKELAEMNPDFAGWIFIDGTRIDYPVMESAEEQERYLHRDFYGKDSYSGTPFVGSGSLKAGSSVVFLYGHHMRNGTMFADLMKYREKKFWKRHPVISLDTRYEHRQYQIFSAFYANEEEWIRDGEILFLAAGARRSLKTEEMELLVKKGLYDTGIVPEAGDSLLFLVTCSYQETGGRFVVVGRRIQ